MVVPTLTKVRDNSGISPQGYAIGADDNTDLQAILTWAAAHEGAAAPHSGHLASASPSITGSPSAATATWVSLGKINTFLMKYNFTAVSCDVTGSYTYWGVTDTSAVRTLTILTAGIVEGAMWIIKDESGAAGLNNIIIATEGVETIQGNATVEITEDYGCLWLYAVSTTSIVILRD